MWIKLAKYISSGLKSVLSLGKKFERERIEHDNAVLENIWRCAEKTIGLLRETRDGHKPMDG